jgi:hypothetical protein
VTLRDRCARDHRYPLGSPGLLSDAPAGLKPLPIRVSFPAASSKKTWDR